MSYLARLKRLDSDKNFTHSPDTALTKPTQPGSVSFGGTVLGHIEKIKGGSGCCVSSIPAHIEKTYAANDGERIDTSTAVEPITDMPGKSPSSFEADSDVDRSSYSLRTAPDNDDRRTCSQCQNLRGRVCSAATPGGLVSANRGYRPAPDTLQRCAGYLPNATDHDQRLGRERWPGL